MGVSKLTNIKNDIEEGNKLIAEFMGIKKGTLVSGNPTFIIDGNFYPPYQLDYHTSWDWLMPVVEKINTIAIDDVGEIEVVIFANMCQIGESAAAHPMIQIVKDNVPLIEIVWDAVIQFIQWYNTTKSKP